MAIQEHVPARLRSALGPSVERIFYNDVLADEQGRPARPGVARRGIITLNQALFERGRTPPWILSSEQCRHFWASRDLNDDANGPAAYSRKSLEVVRFLHEFWSPAVTAGCSVLEVGCNAGPNLEGLRQVGFTDLAGVEISSEAIAEMRRSFPVLSSSATIHHGSVEATLPRLDTSSRDVVFSMAVLMHVHPSSSDVMREMVRVARRYVCVVEPEDVTCGYVFARNYRRVFERLGCVELKTAPILRESFPSAANGYVGYRTRLFAVP